MSAQAASDLILAAALAGRHAEAERRAEERPKAAALARAAGQAELLEAAAEGRAEAVYALLLIGVNPNVRDAAGATPLHLAAHGGHLDAVAYLIGWAPVDTSALDADGRTPLDVAADDAVRRVLTGPPEPAAGDDAEELLACETALLLYLGTSPRAERRSVGEGTAVRTGVLSNNRNGVVCSRATDAEVREALDWLAGVPARWFVDAAGGFRPPGCTPDNDAVYMSATGLQGDAEEVRDFATLRALIRAVGRDDAELSLYGSLGFDGPLRHYALGTDALATVFVHGDTRLLEDVTVAPGARRRGLGSALVCGALAGSRAVLAPTPATIPFYAGLGFALKRYPADRSFSTE